MKINEPLNMPSDLDGPTETPRSDSETIAKMKEEFHAFVTQTRQRLEFLSEAIAAMDRDVQQTDIPGVEADAGLEIPVAAVPDSEVDNSIGHPEVQQSDAASPVPAPTSESHSSTDAGSRASDPNVASRVQHQTDTAEAGQPVSSSPAAPMNATAVTPEVPAAPTSPAPITEPAARTAGPKESDTTAAPVAPDTNPSQGNAEIDSDADPFERLNAIKQRLARQIENS